MGGVAEMWEVVLYMNCVGIVGFVDRLDISRRVVDVREYLQRFLSCIRFLLSTIRALSAIKCLVRIERFMRFDVIRHVLCCTIVKSVPK